MKKSLFEEIFISEQDDVHFLSSGLESAMNLNKGVITDEIMDKLLTSLSKYDAEKLYGLSKDDIASELEKLGVSDNDYNLFKLVIGCEGYDYSKTLKMLDNGIQQQKKEKEEKKDKE
ncbi:hypothetical protein E2566_20910 [Pectobacterium punjabense]|uniref:Uncharacterized protein n=2 Tax=Pectobacteriaceae TaxID=1903410 RepID=A0AAX1C4C8_9GAMM|nr:MULTISPECIES: hypothetical protein [Pectobacteriaceae]MBS4429715.1 hypothetical protein [Pectobacterium punjabense]MCI4002621.1 hypothetical protein [Dickeya dianthicola]PTA64150.1 hypothetical protein C9I36_10600 [Pectobacterium punjabense]PWD71810.1 hypothetical protein DF213_15410 [Dickeya dianthicola]QJA22195.1 hypothetical protein E2566_20910 [Pectobacterium punjabense]